jgi:ATP-dependent DNA ligase
VLGPDGLSRFEELRRWEGDRTTILYAFDLIERKRPFSRIELDGEDLRDLPFLDRKAALARLLRNTKAAVLELHKLTKRRLQDRPSDQAPGEP